MTQAQILRQRCGLVAIIASGLLGMSLNLACSRQGQVSREEGKQDVGVSAADPQDAPTNADNTPLDLKVPTNWKAGRQTAMRKAAFAVEKGEQKAEITVITLTAEAGSLLDSVNGWRKQLGLPPTTQADLDKVVASLEIDGEKGHFVELLGTEDTEQRKSILGVVANHAGEAWFIKLQGDADLVQQEKDTFLDFAKSIRFDAFDGDGASADGKTGASHSVTKRKNVTLVCGQIPTGWTKAELRALRKAAFLVKDGKQKVLITAMQLLPPEGDLLANVNLWRGQVALEPTTQDALDEMVSEIKIAGVDAPYVEITGPEDAERPAAVFAAITPFLDRVWFFTMKGDADLMLREKEHFKTFLKSLKLEVEGDAGK